jgi:hypothetical protein
MWPVYKQDLNIMLKNQEKGKNMAMAELGNLSRGIVNYLGVA